MSVAKESRYARQHTLSNNQPTKRPHKEVKRQRHRFWHRAEYYIIKLVLIITTVIMGLAFIIFACIQYHTPFSVWKPKSADCAIEM